MYGGTQRMFRSINEKELKYINKGICTAYRIICALLYICAALCVFSLINIVLKTIDIGTADIVICCINAGIVFACICVLVIINLIKNNSDQSICGVCYCKCNSSRTDRVHDKMDDNVYINVYATVEGLQGKDEGAEYKVSVFSIPRSIRRATADRVNLAGREMLAVKRRDSSIILYDAEGLR